MSAGQPFCLNTPVASTYFCKIWPRGEDGFPVQGVGNDPAPNAERRTPNAEPVDPWPTIAIDSAGIGITGIGRVNYGDLGSVNAKSNIRLPKPGFGFDEYLEILIWV